VDIYDIGIDWWIFTRFSDVIIDTSKRTNPYFWAFVPDLDQSRYLQEPLKSRNRIGCGMQVSVTLCN